MSEFIYCSNCGKSLVKVEKVVYWNVEDVYCGECMEVLDKKIDEFSDKAKGGD